MPFQFFVTPDNIVELLQKKVEGEIDILTIDIDSYDFFIAKKILENNFRPRLLILEYNFNLGRNVKISYPFTLEPIVTNTKRAFGASFEAMKSLAEQYGYKLVHISGFCNLFFIRHDYSDLFETPDIESEIIHNDRDVLTFIDKYCQKGFIPSWFNSPLVTDKDIEHFQKV